MVFYGFFMGFLMCFLVGLRMGFCMGFRMGFCMGFLLVFMGYFPLRSVRVGVDVRTVRKEYYDRNQVNIDISQPSHINANSLTID